MQPVQTLTVKAHPYRYHFLKEQVENGIIELYFVRTEYQLADMFTKALPEDRFKYLVRRIGMRCLTPAELEDKLIDASFVASFRRNPRGGVEEEQLHHLVELVGSISLSPSNDRWAWLLGSSGEFSVHSARTFIDDILLSFVGDVTRWVKVVPIKVNILAWKVCLDKLPTRLNLSLRGIDIPSIICPNCGLAGESCSHLFYSCNLARTLWRKIARWWEIDIPDFSCYEEWIAWFKTTRFSKAQKEMLEGVFYVMWWMIWKFRNQVLFGSSHPRMELLFDDIVMAISVISISSDSSEDSVGTPAGRVILFGTIPTTIPDTTPVITPPATQTDTPVIPTETPIIAPTIPPSPDYTPASPDYSPASDSESDPSEDPSSDHIPPLPAISPFLSSDDDTTDSDTPDTPPSPTHGMPFNEITASTQRSPIIPRRRVMIISPGQPIPYGRPYRYHLNGPVHMRTARKRVGPLPTHRLAVRHSTDHSSSDSSSEASSNFHSDASSDSSSRHSLSDHSSPDLPSTSAGPSRKTRRSPTTSVPALSPVSGALSSVRADLIPSPKRVKDSGYLADIEVDPNEISLRDDAIFRVSDEPHLEQDIDPEIQAEIDECIAYADALRDRGIDARVVVEAVDRDETETGVRGPVEVRVERVTHPAMPEDIPESAQEGAVEVTYEILGDLVQRFHDHTQAIPVHRIQAIEGVQKEQGHRIVGVESEVIALTERVAELERDNRRLRGTVDATTFSALLDVAPTTLDTSYAVELADGRISETNVVLRGCTLGLLGYPFDIDLMPVELGSFDVIIGMDWLAKYHALIVCDQKVVRIPYGNEVLIIQGDDCDNRSKLNIISCTKTQKYIEKGCQVYLAQVTSKKAEDKSEEKRLDDVSIVQEIFCFEL
ncbi:reverse transcriptase domain-containing protein [Tanacetum coccineum]|uniref:Reverse transcriptase domain-containing protein n=1 Tax=Tanacetum coccineum TaxID=301880 RepID=A0ABQ5F3U0_9ASTR